jgi:anti-sigma B factor antagonist
MSLPLPHLRDGDTVTIALADDLDLSTSDEVEEELIALGSAEGVTHVVLDLSEVRFLDSAGINALLKVKRWADANGRTVRVTGAGGLVREVLELTGVLAHLSATDQ